MMKQTIFNKAVDALNEYMASQGAYVFDPPTMGLSKIDDEYVCLNSQANFYGRYEIATGRFIANDDE